MVPISNGSNVRTHEDIIEVVRVIVSVDGFSEEGPILLVSVELRGEGLVQLLTVGKW